jgi:hypothetical protein
VSQGKRSVILLFAGDPGVAKLYGGKGFGWHYSRLTSYGTKLLATP